MVEKRGLVRERVLRVLLNDPGGELTQYKVAKQAEGAFSWVHDLLKWMDKDNLIKGTKVRDFKRLFHLWADWQVRPERKEYMLKKPLEVLKSTKLQYALTTYQAENLVQSHLFPSRVDFYIKAEDRTKWHNVLTEEGLVGKGNTRLLIADEHVFYGSKVINGFNVVSIPQLIVDLLNEGGVCVEAAEKLMERINDVSTV